MIRSFAIITLVALYNVLGAQTLPAETFQQNLKKEKGILIDVRTPEEFRAERISGSMNLNVNDSLFVKEISKLDKQKAYFLYCGIGKRSAKALQIMKDHGFKKVYDLQKGLGEWKAKGLPTEKE